MFFNVLTYVEKLFFAKDLGPLISVYKIYIFNLLFLCISHLTVATISEGKEKKEEFMEPLTGPYMKGNSSHTAQGMKSTLGAKNKVLFNKLPV